MDFLNDVYLNPLVGFTIDGFLGIEDDMLFDATSKEVRAFKREWVYTHPMYTYLNLDIVTESSTSTVCAEEYLKKMSPYLETIVSQHNTLGFVLPSIQKLPKLRSLTYAIPLILDVTHRCIHPDTYRIFGSVDRLLQTACIHPNQLEHMSIVPGIMKLVRTEEDSDDYVREDILCDTTEGTHCAYYRYFNMPTMFMFSIPRCDAIPNHLRLKSFHGPLWLFALVTRMQLQKDIHCTDWDQSRVGIGASFLDLFN